MYGDSRWSRPSREIRLNVLEQVPSVRLLEARRTGSSAALAISGRIRGEVQQSGTVAPGQGRYESGLRDRSRRLRAVRDADFHRYVGIAFGGQLAVGPLHVRLLAEASVPSLRHERAALCLGTPAMASSVTRLSKIERYLELLLHGVP